MPKGVSCSVSNCSFWKDGNQCNAKEIFVDLDQHAEMFKEEYAAHEFGLNHQDEAGKSSETCCQTFKPKE